MNTLIVPVKNIGLDSQLNSKELKLSFKKSMRQYFD
jgi:hypothetical protein